MAVRLEDIAVLLPPEDSQVQQQGTPPHTYHVKLYILMLVILAVNVKER
jgi:hypothetical protein